MKCFALTDLLPGMERGLYLDFACSEADIVIVLITKDLSRDGIHNAFIAKAFSEKLERNTKAIYI